MIKKKNYAYLIPLLIYLLIFFNVLFKPLVLLDYSYYTINPVIKNQIYSNFQGSMPYDLLTLLLLPLSSLFFQISFFLFSLIAFHYLKKLSKKPVLSFIIFIFNPFLYSRIMVGQLGVILSYLLLPMFFCYLISYLEKKEKSEYSLALSLSAVCAFSIHFFALCLMAFLIGLITYKAFNFKKIALFLLLVLTINAYLFQGLASRSIFSSIDLTHQSFFSPKPSGVLSTPLKIIGLYGFWREVGYITAYKLLPFLLFALLALTILALAVSSSFISQTKRTTFLYALMVISLLLAIGASTSLTKPLFDFLFNNIPFFNGLRDSHKFVSLIALSYSLLIPITVAHIERKFNLKHIVLAVILLFIFYSFPMIGLFNQIKGIEYPNEYLMLKEHTLKNNITGKIIYLPWQTYLTYNWSIGAGSDGRIVNPINKILKQIVYIGPDEWGQTTKTQEEIAKCLGEQSLQCLKDLGINYAIKDRCAFYPEKYDWIDQTIFDEGCVSLNLIQEKKELSKTTVPKRFILGLTISLVSIVFSFAMLFKKNINP